MAEKAIKVLVCVALILVMSTMVYRVYEYNQDQETVEEVNSNRRH